MSWFCCLFWCVDYITQVIISWLCLMNIATSLYSFKFMNVNLGVLCKVLGCLQQPHCSYIAPLALVEQGWLVPNLSLHSPSQAFGCFYDFPWMRMPCHFLKCLSWSHQLKWLNCIHVCHFIPHLEHSAIFMTSPGCYATSWSVLASPISSNDLIVYM